MTEERQVEVKMFLFRAGSRIGEHSFVQAVARQTLLQNLVAQLTFPILSLRLMYPLVNLQKAIENGHRNSRFSHSTW